MVKRSLPLDHRCRSAQRRRAEAAGERQRQSDPHPAPAPGRRPVPPRSAARASRPRLPSGWPSTSPTRSSLAIPRRGSARTSRFATVSHSRRLRVRGVESEAGGPSIGVGLSTGNLVFDVARIVSRACRRTPARHRRTSRCVTCSERALALALCAFVALVAPVATGAGAARLRPIVLGERTRRRFARRRASGAPCARSRAGPTGLDAALDAWAVLASADCAGRRPGNAEAGSVCRVPRGRSLCVGALRRGLARGQSSASRVSHAWPARWRGARSATCARSAISTTTSAWRSLARAAHSTRFQAAISTRSRTTTTANGAIVAARPTDVLDRPVDAAAARMRPNSANAEAFYRERAITDRLPVVVDERSARVRGVSSHDSASNNAYRTSLQDLGLVIANHALSTVDAFITVRLRRQVDAAAIESS